MVIDRIVLSLAALFLIPAAVSAQGNGLAERVGALEAQIEALTRQLTGLTRNLTVDVDCGAGQRLQGALNLVQRHPQAVFINVFGTCTERITISRSNLFLSAGAPSARISPSPPQGWVIRVSPENPTPKAVLLQGLTIEGAVTVEHSSHFRLVDCVIRNTGGFGIEANHRSTVRLDNTTIADGGNSAVWAQNGSHIVVNGGSIRNSGGNGISLHSGSSAVVGGGAQISGSAGDGISAADGSSLRLGAATVNGNGFDGVFLSGGSRVYLAAGATINGNGRSGISLMDTSLAQKYRTTADIQITNNTKYGIVCSDPPAVAQIVGFTFQHGNISGNPLGNIACPISPGPKAP